MLRIILVLAACAFANPADSLRIFQLENRLQYMEAEKAREQREIDIARISAIENDVHQLAAAHAKVDTRALWNAGEKIQASIWLQVIGAGLSVIGGIGAMNDSPGLAIAGSVGGAVLGIVGTVQLFGAGTELKRASTLEGVMPNAPQDTTMSAPLFREGRPPGGSGSW